MELLDPRPPEKMRLFAHITPKDIPPRGNHSLISGPPCRRVRGLKGLRVIDASIIPAALSGDTYATQVMIAEKAADFILERDTVRSIKEYFKHLIATKHQRMVEDETTATTAHVPDVDAKDRAARRR